MSDLLRSVMVECAELARAGRTPAPFYGCAQAAGGGAAVGIVQPPLALTPLPKAEPARSFAAPVVVYDRDADPAAAAAPLAREPRPRLEQHRPPAMRRVA